MRHTPFNRWGTVVLGLCCAVALTGCGMTSMAFVDQFKGKKIFVEDVKIEMPVFTEHNSSSQHRSIPPGLDKSVRAEIINRLQTEGNARVTSNRDDADILLSTKITDYIREAVTLQDNNQIDDYRLRMYAVVTYYDARAHKEIITADINEDSSYELSSDLSRDKSSALTLLLSRVARKAVGVLLDQW